MKKNILLIILIFVMTGCVSEGLRQTYGDEWMEANSDWRAEKKGDNENTNINVTAQIWKQSVEIDNISYDWQGSPDSPSFGIILMTPDAAELFRTGQVTNPEKLPVGSPCFRIQIEGSLTFSTKDWVYKQKTVFGVYDKNVKQYVDGLAVEFDGTGWVTLYLDKRRLNPDQIKVLGYDAPSGKGRFKDFSFSLENTIPCTASLVPSNPHYTKLGETSWATDFILMNEADSFPDNVTKPELGAAYSCTDINYVIGSVSSTDTADATSDNLINGMYSFTASKTGEQWFKFIIAGNGYDYQIGAVNDIVQSLDADIPLENGTDTNKVKFNAEAGSTYQITYNPNVPSCKINKITE
ncbi:MAG: hypothetical protein IKN25_02395 [Spirochaetales bacterium]|nr:hypothetical protein [Spirochaetales bacterium]